MTVTTDGEALLQAILDEPTVDAHRLVYADWLTDNGDPDRGEFIRIQCERARRAREGVRMSDEERTMRDRGDELLLNNFATWRQEFPAGPGAFDVLTLFGRGFVDEVVVDGKGFVGLQAYFSVIYRRHPLRQITVREQWDEYAQQISSTIPPQLKVLHLSGHCEMTRSEASSLISFARHNGWENTLEELAYEIGNQPATDFLEDKLPRVRIRVAGVLWSAQDEYGGRSVLEIPDVAMTTAPVPQVGENQP